MVQDLVRGVPYKETAIDEQSGEVYETGRWVIDYTAENKPLEIAESAIRNKRNKLISETDYLALSDVTLTPEMADYRQALRDITAQEGFPYNVTFPTKPE